MRAMRHPRTRSRTSAAACGTRHPSGGGSLPRGPVDPVRHLRAVVPGGSLAAVAAFVSVAFLFGGVTQLVVAARVQSWRWLFIIAGILGIAAGILTVVWPAITLYVVSVLVAWYLIVFGIVHLVGALAGPSCATGGPSCCWGSPSWCWGVGGPVLAAVAGNPGDPGRGLGHLPRSERDLRRLLGPPGRQGRRAPGRLTQPARQHTGPVGVPGGVRAGLLWPRWSKPARRVRGRLQRWSGQAPKEES